MSQGIVYLLNGLRVAERLAVSIFTLREHWNGSITILARTKEDEEVARQIADSLSCRVLRVERLDQRPMLSKTQIPEFTPYDETLFIDADTVVIGSMDDMFGFPLTLTRYAQWQSNKRLTAKWIGKWKESIEREDFLEMIQVQLEHSYPAINTGVFAFRRDNANLVLWRTLACLNPKAFAVDQTAMQILTSAIPHRMMDDRFNNSATHGHETVDVRLIHWHGGKHCGKRKCAEIWRELFLRAMEANVGGLREWAGRYDKGVRNWLEEK